MKQHCGKCYRLLLLLLLLLLVLVLVLVVEVAGACGYGEEPSSPKNAGNFLTSCRNQLVFQEGLCSMQ